MDLDIPAWVSYALITVVSAFAAATQVHRLLSRVPLRWLHAEAYLLFIGFFLLPLVLFWALDRVGALHDCSLISALLVALGYPAIISGDSKPGNSAVSAVFSPVLKWLNGIPGRLAARLQSKQLEFETSIMNAVGRDDALLVVLENWMIENTDDLVAVQTKIQEWDADAPRPAGFPPGSLPVRAWSQARALRLAMLVDGTFWVRFRFWRLGLTTARVAWRDMVRIDQTFRFGLPLVLIAILVLFAVNWFRGASPDAQQSVVGDLTLDNVVPRYHAWRYLKANNTATDVHRALVNLAVGLQLEIPVCPMGEAAGQARTDRGGSDKETGGSHEKAGGGVEERGVMVCPGDVASEKDPKKLEQRRLALAEERGRGLYSRQVSNILQQKDLTVVLANDLLKTLFAGRLERRDLPTACAALLVLPPGLRSANVEIRNLLKRSLSEASKSLWGGPGGREDAMADPQAPANDVGPDVDTVGIEVAVVKWGEFLAAHCAAPASAQPDPGSLAPPAANTLPVPDAPIVLSSDVTFEFDSARLRNAAAAELSDVLALFRAHDHLRADIRGYTDSVGTAAYNLRLSEHRANSVKEFLVTRGVRKEDLGTTGFGAENPVAENDTPQGRAKNRRVEIQLQQAG